MELFDISWPVWLALGLAILYFWITRPGGEAEGKGIYTRWQRGWRRLAFWGGDVCLLSTFPWITWAKHECDLSLDEYAQALKSLRAGDIGIATKRGYILSNSAIPGLFKHAMLITAGPKHCDGSDVVDTSGMQLTEAISRGVVEHHPLNAHADLMMFLRPLHVTEADRDKAVRIAGKLVGLDYDANFDFDIEGGLRTLRETTMFRRSESEWQQERRELENTVANVSAEFDIACSCTETVALAWWHCRHALRIYRKRLRGRDIITSDQFVTHAFEIVWTNVTVAQAQAGGLHEEGVEMLKDYWQAREPAW